MLQLKEKKPGIAIVNFAVMALALCSPLQRADNQGPGTEVIGRAVDRFDSGPVLATVLLRKNDFLADTGGHDTGLPQAVTDADGSFSFDNVEPGSYTIEALDTSRALKRFAAIMRIEVAAGTPQVDAGEGVMKPAGTISGTLESGGVSWVQVYGLQRIAKADPATGIFILRDIPEGEYSLHVVSSSSAVVARVLDSVSAPSGDTVRLPFAGWPFSKRLYCNTTVSGAGVSGTVTRFPVLVRLTGNNFNFSQAKRDGADLRFTKQDGSPMPFEIERWDSANGRAEVWVRADTVYGNDDSHYFIMYWGLRSTSPLTGASNGAAVFDTVQGNLGVWHLGPGLGDATGNGDNGIDSSTGDTAGIIGRCRWFDPAKHSFITIPNESRFDITTNITLYAWMRADTVALEWQTIIAKGDNTYRLHRDSISDVTCFSMTTADTADFGYKDLPGTTPFNDHAWHLVCGVFDGSVMRTYVDGALEGEKAVAIPCLTNDSSVTIGDNKPRSQRFFHGAIDEVRVMHAAVGADWVKLSYMNQKAGGDALVVFQQGN
jgi:hypothetical protein